MAQLDGAPPRDRRGARRAWPTLEFWNGGGLRVRRGDGRRRRGHRDRRRLGPAGARRSSTTTRRSSRARRRSSGSGSTRKPTPGMATVHGGGLIAQRADRRRTGSPVPWAPPGLHLTGLEGAGEVQTPLTGHPAALLGSATWCGSATPSPASSFEHVRDVHLLARRGDHRGGAVLPRLRTVPSDVPTATSPPRSPSACSPRPRRSARAAWCASTAPPGPGKTTLAAALADVVPVRRSCTATSCCEGWRGLPGLAAHVDGLLAPLAARRAGPLDRAGTGSPDDWAETIPVAPGGLLVLEGVGCWSPGDRRPASTCWCGSRPTSDAPARARDGARRRADAGRTGSSGRRRGRAVRPARHPGTRRPGGRDRLTGGPPPMPRVQPSWCSQR